MRSAKTDAERFTHAPHAASRRVDEETIILDLNTRAYYSLNGTGSFIWERLGAGAAASEIAAALCAEFDVTPEDASRDVSATVAELRKKNLLLPVRSPRDGARPKRP